MLFLLLNRLGKSRPPLFLTSTARVSGWPPPLKWMQLASLRGSLHLLPYRKQAWFPGKRRGEVIRSGLVPGGVNQDAVIPGFKRTDGMIARSAISWITLGINADGDEKRNLKPQAFYGTSENAVPIKIWTAMMAYLLLLWIKIRSFQNIAILNEYRKQRCLMKKSPA
jgi:hypothetical protein